MPAPRLLRGELPLASLAGTGEASPGSPCAGSQPRRVPHRFIQGSTARSPYCFYHWQSIDVFVYFSHHTVTIPPVGWTNAAHRHGVCMLGKTPGLASHAPSLAHLPGDPVTRRPLSATEGEELTWGCLDRLAQARANFWKGPGHWVTVIIKTVQP